jgi:hypothetical protein
MRPINLDCEELGWPVQRDLHKVHFKLVQDEDGYPPFTSEAMWCVRIDNDRFRLDNIPYFVTGISYDDVISVLTDEEGRLNFHQVLEENGHSTLRVMFLGTPADPRPVAVRAKELQGRLTTRGCLTRISPSPEILAVDVPPSIPIGEITDLLSEGEANGLWSSDEGTLAQ